MTWLSNDDGFLDDGPGAVGGVLSMSWTWQELGPESGRGGLGPQTPEMVEAMREREREEAYERGFNDGVDAGRSQARKELSPNLQASVSVVAEVEDVILEEDVVLVVASASVSIVVVLIMCLTNARTNSVRQSGLSTPLLLLLLQ